MARSTPVLVISSKSTRTMGARLSRLAGNVPGYGLPLPVRVRRQEDPAGRLGGLLDVREGLGLSFNSDVLGLEVIVHVHTQLAGRQVPYMADRSFYIKAAAQVLADRLGLGGRLDDDQGPLPRYRCAVPFLDRVARGLAGTAVSFTAGFAVAALLAALVTRALDGFVLVVAMCSRIRSGVNEVSNDCGTKNPRDAE